MKKFKVLFFIVFLPSFAHSQQWQQYSDSIISNINKNNFEKANNFSQLADNDLLKTKFVKDTLYANYLYAKGVLYSFDETKNGIDLLNESLNIWNYSDKKNYFKIMKIHYFLGAGYHLKLDYLQAYENYEKCYLINKKYKLPWNNNFSNSIYYLAVIDYNTNLNYKKAEKYAQEYIEYNKETALLNYDFKYAYAYKLMNDIYGLKNVLIEFNKNYIKNNLKDLQLLYNINYELFSVCFELKNIKEIITFGEKALALYEVANIKNENYLMFIYPKLIYAYSQINDNLNQDKYTKLNDKYIHTETNFAIQLNKLYRDNNLPELKIKFDIYEPILKERKDYNSLFYAYVLINDLFKKNIIFTKEDLLSRIDFIISNWTSFSQEEKINFDLIISDFYSFTEKYKEAILICNRYLNIDNLTRKLTFYRIKSICEEKIGESENSKKTLIEAYKIASKIYDENDSRLLPIINDILNIKEVNKDKFTFEIISKTPDILYYNNLEKTDLASRTWISLGKCMMNIYNNADAEIYFEKSLKIQESSKYIKHENDYFICLGALCLLKLKDYDLKEAKVYLDKMKLYLDSSLEFDKSIQGDYYDNLGWYYFYDEKYTESKYFFEKSFSFPFYKENQKHNFLYLICKYILNKNISETISSINQFEKENKNFHYISELKYLIEYNYGKIESAEKLLLNIFDNELSENKEYFHLLSDYERENLYRNFSNRFEYLNAYLLNNSSEFLNKYINLRFYSKSLLFSNSFNSFGENEKHKELYLEYKNNIAKINKSLENKSSNLKLIEELKYKNREIEKVLSSNTKSKPILNLNDLNNKIKLGDAYIEIIRINKQTKHSSNKGLEDVFTKKFTDSISYGAIVIKKNSTPKFILIDGTNQLEKQYASNFKSKILNKQEDNESYHLLFEKIDEELKDVKKIYLVTDGVYNSINIESIYNPNRKKYLLDYLKIQQIQNVRAITDEKKEFKVGMNTKTILFGNPDFDLLIANKKENEFSLERGLDNELLDEIKTGVKISPLNGTQKEIETLDTILNNSNSTVELFSKANATEDNLKKIQSPDILHIATHGYFLSNDDTSKTKQSIANLFNDNYKNDSYLKSGLLLAGAQNTLNGKQPENSNNGILTSEEAKSLNLKNTELVVLSACETGLGDNLVGEGVIGLQRAFMIAGAKSVIMSLWSVSDEKTQELMTMFYTNWIKNNMSKEEALYQAKIEMKKLYPQPYYWAGFVLLE
jgi:CHAT domain-containing protein